MVPWLFIPCLRCLGFDPMSRYRVTKAIRHKVPKRLKTQNTLRLRMFYKFIFIRSYKRTHSSANVIALYIHVRVK